jgi:hypothetical protein
MSETTSRVKISGFSQDRKDVRIIETDGQLVPYKVENIEIHPKMDGGDYVDAVYLDGKLVKLVYPPGLEPEGPSKTEIHKQFVEEAKTAKVLQWQIAHIDGSKVVLTKGDLDAQFKLIENAAKFHKSFHQGDLVQFVKADEKTIKTLWKVDENGKRPEKSNGYGQSGNVEKAAWIQVLGNISIAAEQYQWTDEKVASAVNRAIRLYNAFGTSLDKEVKN